MLLPAQTRYDMTWHDADGGISRGASKNQVSPAQHGSAPRLARVQPQPVEGARDEAMLAVQIALDLALAAVFVW
jgi:hypothetical protein